MSKTERKNGILLSSNKNNIKQTYFWINTSSDPQLN